MRCLSTKVSSSLIRSLREQTGAPIMQVKKALSETGSVENAIEYLRKHGLKLAEKKQDREATEGVISIRRSTNSSIQAIEILCETDFVSRNSTFKTLAKNLLNQLPAEENLSASEFKENVTVKNILADATVALSEKIHISSIWNIPMDLNTVTGVYMHNGIEEDSFLFGSKFGLVSFDAQEKLEDPEIKIRVEEVAADLSLHLVAQGEVDTPWLEQDVISAGKYNNLSVKDVFESLKKETGISLEFKHLLKLEVGGKERNGFIYF
eukprot:snap_masked-scaffold_8-processed-gene-4.21-mRNA-1 protein AED:0.65 eAED:0.65 QI:0/-1/0/1/-1/1/1/0/264